MALNQRGEGKAGMVFGLLVLGLVVYGAIKIVPVMITIYSYEDKVEESCKFAGEKTPDQLRAELADMANKEGLPMITEDNIQVTKKQIEDHFNLIVDIDYTVPISTPVKIFNWDKKFHYEAPIFN